MESKQINISARCTGCGVCISRCPERALEFHTDDENRKRVRCITEKCTRCGKCIPYCQFSAISMK